VNKRPQESRQTLVLRPIHIPNLSIESSLSVGCFELDRNVPYEKYTATDDRKVDSVILTFEL
jgi:hypothetical protein